MALAVTHTVHIFCAWLKAGRRRFVDADRPEIQSMVQIAGTIELLDVRRIEIRKFGPLGQFHDGPILAGSVCQLNIRDVVGSSPMPTLMLNG